MSQSIDFLIQNRDSIVPVVKEHGPAKAYSELLSVLPDLADAMTKQTFRMYVPVLVGVAENVSPVVAGYDISFDELKRAGETFFGWFGSWAYDQWAELNERYFGSQNQVGGIVWGLTAYGKSIGEYTSRKNIITLHKTLVREESGDPWSQERLESKKQYAREVLLHEMMHQRIDQEHGFIPQKGQSPHNNEYWAGEINRLLEILGVDSISAIKVTQRRVHGKPSRDWVKDAGYLTQNEMAHFPHWLTDKYGIQL